MKRFFIFLSFISVISLASCKMLNSNQAFYFDNKTDKTVTVKCEGANITVNPHDKVRYEAAPTADFSIPNYYRCDLSFSTNGRYIITDRPAVHVTVSNASNKIIVVQETSNNIGSYAQLQTIATNTSTSIDNVVMKIEVPANGSTTFDVYPALNGFSIYNETHARYINYSTYYKDSGKVLDSREYITFN